MKTSEIIHDKENHQLYLEAGEENIRALVEYEIKDDKMYLTKTEVPKELGGNGIGKILVENSLQKLVDEGYDKEYEMIADCSFIKYFVEKNDKWGEIVSL
ncbi:GNAT family N-acetyltransferase [uncultured Cocleimonas sp.]|uniref:GNAT family N-acetyltransferase n=1 Tax=uncultured Cocleimonas sp. TaxID=1051587 RepID=UPI00260B7D1E|nr:GNAT family N-acetyltransferase [uncultured Cocleimonas sp.]